MSSSVIDRRELRNRTHVFKDRLDAGMMLAVELEPHMKTDSLLLALPAGGVPVSYVIAKRLGLPLDVAVVRKIQIPWNTEAGFGAVSWDGTVALNETIVSALALTPSQIQESIARTRKIVLERVRKFRGDKPLPDMQQRSIILADDGLASGYTMMTAIDSVRKQKPREITVAVPTGSREAVGLVSRKADLTICLNVREGPVFAVADAYEEWYDLTDEEVIQYLKRASLDSDR